MTVPWEYLYDDPAFLSISMWTPVVRYLDLASTRRPLRVEAPLRMLGMVRSPAPPAGQAPAARDPGDGEQPRRPRPTRRRAGALEGRGIARRPRAAGRS